MADLLIEVQIHYRDPDSGEEDTRDWQQLGYLPGVGEIIHFYGDEWLLGSGNILKKPKRFTGRVNRREFTYSHSRYRDGGYRTEQTVELWVTIEGVEEGGDD